MFAGQRINDIDTFLNHYNLNDPKWGVKAAMAKNEVTLDDFFKLPVICIGSKDVLREKVFLLDISRIQKGKFLRGIKKESIKGREILLINQLKSQIEKLRNSNCEYKYQNCSLMNECKKLQLTLHGARKEIDELKMSNDEYRRQNRKLLKETELNQNEEVEVNELKAKMNKIEIRNKKLHELATELLKDERGLKSQIKSLQKENQKLKISNHEYHVQNDRLMHDCKESELRLKEMQNKMNQIDPTRYLEWTSTDLVLWICNLDNGRYEQYKDKLLPAFKKQGVDGKGMRYLDKQDLMEFGVEIFMDRSVIYEHIQNVVNNNKINDNQHGYISHVIEGQDETNYMQ